MTATEQGSCQKQRKQQQQQQQQQQQRSLGRISARVASPKPSGSHHQVVVSPRSAHQADSRINSRPFSAVFKQAQTACGVTYQLQPEALLEGTWPPYSSSDQQQQQQQPEEQAGSAPASTVKSRFQQQTQQHSELLLHQQHQQHQQHALLHQQHQQYALLHQQQQQRLLVQQLGNASTNTRGGWRTPAVAQANTASSHGPAGTAGASYGMAARAAVVPLQPWRFQPMDRTDVLAPVTPEQPADNTLGGASPVSDAGGLCKRSSGADGRPGVAALGSPEFRGAAADTTRWQPTASRFHQCFHQQQWHCQQQQQQQQRLELSVSMPMSHHPYAESVVPMSHGQYADSAMQRPTKRQQRMTVASTPHTTGCLDPLTGSTCGSGTDRLDLAGQGKGPLTGRVFGPLFSPGFSAGQGMSQIQGPGFSNGFAACQGMGQGAGLGQCLHGPAAGRGPGILDQALGPGSDQGFTTGFLQGLSQVQLQLLVTPAEVVLLQKQQQQQSADLGAAHRSYTVQRIPSKKRRHTAVSPVFAAAATDDASAAAAAAATAAAAAGSRAAKQQLVQTGSAAAEAAGALGSISQLLHVSDSRQAAVQLSRMSRSELFQFAAAAVGCSDSTALGQCASANYNLTESHAAAAGIKCTADCSPASSASTADFCLSSEQVQHELKDFYSKSMTPTEAAEKARAAAAAVVAAAKAAATAKVHGTQVSSGRTASPACRPQQQGNVLSTAPKHGQQQQQPEGPPSPAKAAAARSQVEHMAHCCPSALPAFPTTLATAALAASASTDCNPSVAGTALWGSADGALSHGGQTVSLSVGLDIRGVSDGFAGLEGFTPAGAAVLEGAVLPETPFGVSGFQDVSLAWEAEADDWELLG